MANSRMLAIHQGALGDFILTFPAITRLQAYFSPIDVLCQNQLGKLAQTLRLTQNSYPLEAARFASLFSDQIDSNTRSLFTQYKNILLFSLSDRLEQSINNVSANLCCRVPPRPPAHQTIHVAQFILEKIFNCGFIKEADVRFNDSLLPVRNQDQFNSKKILLHPGAGSTRKRWPMSSFLKVEAALKADGLTTEFILGPAEEGLIDELRHADQRVHELNDLTNLLALLTSAGGYIGNDSGASHLAAYLGIPSAVIFGPADPVRWAPLGRSVKIIRPVLSCRPCFEIDETNCDAPRCLEGITPQKVIKAFYRVYTN